MKKQWMFSLAVFLILVLSACGESPEPPKVTVETAVPEPAVATPDCNLKMGWDPWEPYQYLTPEDEVHGLEVDLISAMANEAGCDITFVQDNWMNLLAGIRNGSVDLLGGATKTAAREEFAYFSDSYRHESFSLYIRPDESDKYADKSLLELLEGGFMLGVTQDYLYCPQINALQDDERLSSQFVSVPITEVNYYNLTQGHIDGFLEDPFVGSFTIRRKGLQGQIEPLALEISSGDVSIIFSKESVEEETVQAFNTALAKLRETGEYREILAKYRR
jgi:polar amino acid transport system substrate-binding protein